MTNKLIIYLFLQKNLLTEYANLITTPTKRLCKSKKLVFILAEVMYNIMTILLPGQIMQSNESKSSDKHGFNVKMLMFVQFIKGFWESEEFF